MNIKTTLNAPTQMHADAVLREDYGIGRPAYSTAYEAAWVFSFTTQTPYIVASADDVKATVADAERAPTFISHMVHGTQPVFSDAGCLGLPRTGAYSLIPLINEDTLTSAQVETFISFWQAAEQSGITGYDATALWAEERALRSLTSLDNEGAIRPESAESTLSDLYSAAASSLITMMGDNTAEIDATSPKVIAAQEAVDRFRQRLLYVLTLRATQIVSNTWVGIAYGETTPDKTTVPVIPKECRAILRSAYPTYYADGPVPAPVAPLLIGSLKLTNLKPIISVNGTASGFASDGDLSLARAMLALRLGFDPFEHSMWVDDPQTITLTSGAGKSLFLSTASEKPALLTVSDLIKSGVGKLRRSNGITYYPTQPRFPRDGKITPLFSTCREIVYPHVGAASYPLNDPLTFTLFKQTLSKLPASRKGMIPILAWDFRVNFDAFRGLGLDESAMRAIAKSLWQGCDGSDKAVVVGRYAETNTYARYTVVACQNIRLSDSAFTELKKIYDQEEEA